MDAGIVSNQVVNSLQVSILGDVPPSDFILGLDFLIKNISDEDVEATIIPAGQKESIKTIMGIGMGLVSHPFFFIIIKVIL